MRSPKSSRKALRRVARLTSSSIFALTGMLLGACGGARMGAVPQPALVSMEGAKPAHSLRVYVSDEKRNLVAVFNNDGKRVQTISATGGLNHPQNLFVDASGQLWVANEGGHDVLEFPPGSVYPTAVLADGKNLPADVTICPNGTVFVANIFSPKHAGDITVYKSGAKRASRTLTYNGSEFTGITCDPNGNVFATGVVGTFGSVVAFPHGQQAGAKQLPISSSGNLGGIKIDSARQSAGRRPGGPRHRIYRGGPADRRLDSHQRVVRHRVRSGRYDALRCGCRQRGRYRTRLPGRLAAAQLSK